MISEASKLRRSGLNIEAFDCEAYLLDAARDTLGGYAKLHVPIGYPAGNATQKQKLYQLEYLLREAVDDSCYCIDYANLADGRWADVTAETRRVMELCRDRLPMAIVIQATLLDDRKKVDACKSILEGGANRVKVNTGYGWGTSPEEVDLIWRHFDGQIDIHPSGNVRTFEQIEHFLKRGVTVCPFGVRF